MKSLKLLIMLALFSLQTHAAGARTDKDNNWNYRQTFRQGVVVKKGLTADDITLSDDLIIQGISKDAELFLDTHSATNSHTSKFSLRKDGSASLTAFGATADGEALGNISFWGVNTALARTMPAKITVDQVFAPGSLGIGASMSFFTAQSSANSLERMTIESTGYMVLGNGLRLETDEVQARDSSGLKLYEDGGSGVFVEDATGDVGIGTATPHSVQGVGKFLHIQDSTSAGIVLSDTSFNGPYEIFTDAGGLNFNQNGMTHLTIDSSGYMTQKAGVWLATEKVTARSNLGLQLSEDGGQGIFITDSTGDASMGTETALVLGGTNFTISGESGNSDGALNFQNPAAAVSTPMGRIGFYRDGVFQAYIYGMTEFAGTDASQLLFGTNTGGGAPSAAMRISSTNLVSIGAVAGVTAGTKLHVAGNGVFTGSVDAANFITISDEGLKKDFASIDSPLAVMSGLDAVQYKFKDSASEFSNAEKLMYDNLMGRKTRLVTKTRNVSKMVYSPIANRDILTEVAEDYDEEETVPTDYSSLSGSFHSKLRVGFTAQDVCENIPVACAGESKGGIMRYEPDALIPIMWEAIKKLDARVKVLEGN